MTATTTPTRPQLSGFCGYSHRHDLCRVGFCACTCHRVELMPLSDALIELCRAVCGKPGVVEPQRHDPICQTVRHHLAAQEPR